MLPRAQQGHWSDRHQDSRLREEERAAQQQPRAAAQRPLQRKAHCTDLHSRVPGPKPRADGKQPSREASAGWMTERTLQKKDASAWPAHLGLLPDSHAVRAPTLSHQQKAKHDKYSCIKQAGRLTGQHAFQHSCGTSLCPGPMRRRHTKESHLGPLGPGAPAPCAGAAGGTGVA